MIAFFATGEASARCFAGIQVFERKSESNCDRYSSLVLNGNDTGIYVCSSSPFVTKQKYSTMIQAPRLSKDHPSCQNPSFRVSGCEFRVTFSFSRTDRARFSAWLKEKLPGEFIAVLNGHEILHQRWPEDFDFGGLRVGYLRQSERDMRIFQSIRDAAKACQQE